MQYHDSRDPQRSRATKRRAFAGAPGMNLARRCALALAACALMLAWSACGAAGLSTTARAEIDALLVKLERSGCRFNRNGSWYDAAQAREHLQRKLDYAIEHDMLGSPEQFIAEAASRSSMSGEEYLVHCPGGQPQASATWLHARLDEIRRQAAKKPAP